MARGTPGLNFRVFVELGALDATFVNDKPSFQLPPRVSSLRSVISRIVTSSSCNPAVIMRMVAAIAVGYLQNSEIFLGLAYGIHFEARRQGYLRNISAFTEKKLIRFSMI